MKKYFVSFFSFIFLFVGVRAAQAQSIDQLSFFSSHLTLNQDTSLTITETLEYETNLQKHGIYRYLPLTYNHDGVKERLKIKNIQVKDKFGEDIPFSKTSDSKFLTLKIGDPEQTFTGEKTYLINYQVESALRQAEDFDFLLWDITGEGWQIPIVQSQAVLTSPYAEITKFDCYTGSFGSNDNLCTIESTNNQELIFSYSQVIDYGSNFTVHLQLDPDNQLLFPSALEKKIAWFRENWTLFLIPFPLFIMFVWWWKKGRDLEFISPNVFNLDVTKPSRLQPFTFHAREPYVYAPLEQLTPGEAGALIDEKVDNQDIVAEILELARKKYLKLELLEEKKLLGKSRDYQLTWLKDAAENLPAVQKYLFTELFKNRKQVKISSLKGSFYKQMQKSGELLQKSLLEKRMYTAGVTSRRVKAFAVAYSLLIVLFVILQRQLFNLGILWPLIPLVLQVPFISLIAYQMPQKTAVGHNLFLQARGLKKSIRYGKWREKIKEKNLFIEEVLPFAVALGVVDQLAKQMKQLNLETPTYLNSTTLSTWSTAQFVSGFSNEMASSLSYNPSSSSSSSGGGFSGGGGGGGGGGSW